MFKITKKPCYNIHCIFYFDKTQLDIVNIIFVERFFINPLLSLSIKQLYYYRVPDSDIHNSLINLYFKTMKIGCTVEYLINGSERSLLLITFYRGV